MADAGYESRKLARELKRRHGWRLHITKRRQRAFKVVGLTWIVERTFAWLARNRRLSKGRSSHATMIGLSRPPKMAYARL